jgi:hypothetical protein
MKLPTVAEITTRYQKACKFDQTIDEAKIAEALTAWAKSIPNMPVMNVVFPKTESEINAARAAWAARAARAAWDARDARAAWAAWAAWDARAAWDVDWVSIVAIGSVELNDLAQYSIWVHLLEALEAGAWFFWFTETEIAVIPIPSVTKTDPRNRLHCETGPAMVWLDAHLYYWHGIEVSADVIERPDTITIKQIEQTRNAEVRRVLMERYGFERYLLSSGAKMISRDAFGELLSKDIPGDEPLVMVRVENSTPEPDGQRKAYLLRVPPTIRTAHAAVAWTFGMKPEDYHPHFEA